LESLSTSGEDCQGARQRTGWSSDDNRRRTKLRRRDGVVKRTRVGGGEGTREVPGARTRKSSSRSGKRRKSGGSGSGRGGRGRRSSFGGRVLVEKFMPVDALTVIHGEQ